MYRLRNFSKRTGDIGKPLPAPFRQLEEPWRAHFRYGQTAMIAGAPGTMKSIMALNLAVYWARCGLTGLYFSADSDEFTVSKRQGAILTGDDERQVEQAMLTQTATRYTNALSALDFVPFVYSSNGTDDIKNHIDSFEAVHGSDPNFIIVDNLINYAETLTDWQYMAEVEAELDRVARETQAHVLVLHHTTESASVQRPPPRDAIQGKITQIPRLVLTVGVENMSIYLAVVKNTNGKQDPLAQQWLYFNINPALQVNERQFGAMAA
jgi:KaiC/GvpD/RAD55 family RecA-like ATPase